MIQELLGASSGFIASSSSPDSKISINNNPAAAGVLSVPNHATAVASTTAATSSATASSNNPDNQNLRCPRCDSSNTKFCYYNNYNLTQPRHFCKTCRRYWTKGGALRNVPIGGGCRKNKTVGVMSLSSNSIAKSSTAAKMKTVVSELGSRNLPGVLGTGTAGGGTGGGFDHHHHQELPVNPSVLWGSPQNSHLLALLRASQNPNPSSSNIPPPHISSNNGVKDEMSLLGSQSHMVVTEPMGSNGLLGGLSGNSGFDPSIGFAGSSSSSCFWRNGGGFDVLGGGSEQQQHQNSNGIQELYQRLKSSSSSPSPNNNYCSDDTSALFLGNMASSSSSSSSSSLAILESAPIGLGYWNQHLSSTWSDLPTTNGASAYP